MNNKCGKRVESQENCLFYVNESDIDCFRRCTWLGVDDECCNQERNSFLWGKTMDKCQICAKTDRPFTGKCEECRQTEKFSKPIPPWGAKAIRLMHNSRERMCKAADVIPGSHDPEYFRHVLEDHDGVHGDGMGCCLTRCVFVGWRERK